MFGKDKNKEIKRLLVMRFSAMGDVAMTVPVLYCLAKQNPQLRITMLTRSRMAAFYEWLPSNVTVRGINLDDYKGIFGLGKLYGSLKDGDYDAVCDLHDVLRTKYIRTRFKMSGTPVVAIDKGRKDKHALIGNAMNQDALRPMVERYADVFRALNLNIDLAQAKAISVRGENFADVTRIAGTKGENDKWIGIAPFAAHAQKIYPLDKMKQVANLLHDKGCKVFLFGAGKAESELLASWEHDGIISVCGKMGGLHNEILLMSRLNAMISMDSANMHIASFVGTPVISIWGATHPKAGFTGFGQSADSILQLDLPCRPCSIYGNKPCQFGDMRCMNISPESIADKVMKTC